jgi:hypothetical protein
MKLLRLLLLMCLSVSLLAVAQEKTAKKPADKKPADASMQMPKPSPEIQKLAKTLAGNYSTTETHDPNPMMPKGGTGKGQARFTVGPGGHYVVESYNSKSDMGSFTGHGVFWWDPKVSAYRVVWCDSMSPTCDTEGTMKWEGDKLVASGEYEMGGKKVAYRETIGNLTPNGFTFDMESAMGGSMQHVMKIDYTRATSASAGKTNTEKPAAQKQQ